VTDTKGRITYCNDAFIEVSGFSRAELLGQPHNIVRHPDMPPEAFRDMWETIQTGVPWTGVVKNRRKNGDHYWVQANAAPMMHGDRISGFLSVRTQPSREAIAAAEKLYAEMMKEAERGRLVHVLKKGQVLKRNWLGRLHRLRHPKLSAKLFGVQSAAIAAVATLASLGLPWPVTALLSLLACGGVTWASWRLAVQPMQAVLRDAHRMAAGDLSHDMGEGARGMVGEFQQALMQMSLNLRTVVGDTRTEVRRVYDGSLEIAEGNQELSARTESQASSLQQTAASMEQINGTVMQSAAAAQRGMTMALETADIARRSHEAVQAVSDTMAGISESSRRIEEIIQVIEGVAFQTNVLALNAAVEAARAGESGRGFAVVAAEVRALSQRTSHAAGEIKQLIQDSAKQVAEGEVRSAEARERMDEALRSVDSVKSMLEEINLTASEQQAGIAQINEAVNHMDTITQQNAAMVEQLAAAAKSLQEQVGSAMGSMGLFRLDEDETTVAEIDAVALRKAFR